MLLAPAQQGCGPGLSVLSGPAPPRLRASFLLGLTRRCGGGLSVRQAIGPATAAASPALEVGQRYTGPSPGGGQPNPSVDSERIPLVCAALQPIRFKERAMNNFRMGLLKERAAEIRPDLDHAREIIQKAEGEKRDLTPEEKAIVGP
jgi:hypothetical protein